MWKVEAQLSEAITEEGRRRRRKQKRLRLHDGLEERARPIEADARLQPGDGPVDGGRERWQLCGPRQDGGTDAGKLGCRATRRRELSSSSKGAEI